ncbi:MAG TPA: hypothetical protein ENF51_00585 [Candidatus Aenigmarchaeota archaeon]|nr:hypothetical protein [Candidatus Aenigmarchaeota archaeon]
MRHDELIRFLSTYLLEKDPLSYLRKVEGVNTHVMVRGGEIDLLLQERWKVNGLELKVQEIVEVQRNYSRNGLNLFCKKRKNLEKHAGIFSFAVPLSKSETKVVKLFSHLLKAEHHILYIVKEDERKVYAYLSPSTLDFLMREP